MDLKFAIEETEEVSNHFISLTQDNLLKMVILKSSALPNSYVVELFSGDNPKQECINRMMEQKFRPVSRQESLMKLVEEDKARKDYKEGTKLRKFVVSSAHSPFEVYARPAQLQDKWLEVKYVLIYLLIKSNIYIFFLF